MPNTVLSWSLALVPALGLAACTTATADPGPTELDAVARDVHAPHGCITVAAIARPIAAPQFHDAALQQTAGELTLRLDRGEVRHGTILATLVGKTDDGALLGNHDALFAGVGFRTRGDRIVAKPSANKCLLDVATELVVVEGSGPLAKLTGTLHGSGRVDLCGGVGRVAIAGYLCPTH